jgi:hypothetical protein
MSRDQALGAAILILCAVIALAYITGLFLYPTLIQPWLNLGETQPYNSG